jgi:hypothetical protein
MMEDNCIQYDTDCDKIIHKEAKRAAIDLGLNELLSDNVLNDIKLFIENGNSSNKNIYEIIDNVPPKFYKNDANTILRIIMEGDKTYDDDVFNIINGRYPEEEELSYSKTHDCLTLIMDFFRKTGRKDISDLFLLLFDVSVRIVAYEIKINKK